MMNILFFKSFIVLIFIYYVKFFSVFFLFVHFAAQVESEFFLKKNYKVNINKYENYEFRPIIFWESNHNLPISTILYYAYSNLVFDVTYAKIKYGRKKLFILYLKNPYNLLRILFFWYIGFSRVVFQIIKSVVFNKENIGDFLLFKFMRISDDRLILKINNEWKVNGSQWMIFIEQISLRLHAKLGHSNATAAILMINKWKQDLNEITYYHRSYRAIFVDKSTKIPHSVYLDIHKSVDKLG
jgi:hypothetical protein